MGVLRGFLPGPADAFGLGLVLALIGAFLLANSILFRHPRALVAEHFGRPREKLVSIRGSIFHRLQIQLGFLFLLIGLALQIFGHFGAREAPPAEPPSPLSGAWIGTIVAALVALELGGWWLSHALFLRHVREYFHAHPPALETDLDLARELGELLGIDSAGDDSVQSYLLRIRQRLGLPEGTRGPSARERGVPPDPEEGFV